MDISPQQLEEERRLEEEEKKKSALRAVRREEAQTVAVHTTLVRGSRGFGLGIADADGHCVVHRLVRTQYYEDDEESSPSKKLKVERLRFGDRIVKVGDKSTPSFQEALDAIKATPRLLVLELRRDPDYPDQREWVRDRIWNHSIVLYRVIQFFIM